MKALQSEKKGQTVKLKNGEERKEKKVFIEQTKKEQKRTKSHFMTNGTCCSERVNAPKQPRRDGKRRRYVIVE